MKKMVTIGEKEDTKNTKSNSIGALFAIIVFISISLLIFFVVEARNKPSHLISEAISSVYKLQERLKGRMLVMEKGGFNDSDNYRQAEDIKTELELVRDKMIEIKIKLKDKPWAN